MKRRTTVVLGVAVVLSLAAVYGVNRLAAGGEVTEVGVDEALDRYREQTATTSLMPAESAPTSASDATTAAASSVPAALAALPAPGVYQYATSGFDRIDALTGAQHDYPAITTMTVTPEGCGVRVRWDVAVERWDTWDWCLDGAAIRQNGWVGYHEFFDSPGRNDYLCDGDPRPLDALARTTWTMVCRMGDHTTSTFRGEVIERTSLMVAGIATPVLHVRYEVEVVGESTGHQTVEGWYRIADGLPVREQLAISTTQDTVIGATRFDEQYTIDLLTPSPTS